jgi:hypothetical protein
MTEFTPTLPIAGKPASSEEPKVTTALSELQTILNGKIGTVNIETGKALVATANNYSAIVTYTKAEAEAGVEPSTTRMAVVLLSEPKATNASSVFVGGQQVGKIGIASSSVTALVPAGQKWKTTVETQESHLLL